MRTPLGSSGFVNCPACDAHVPYATINVHLDTDCAALGPRRKQARGSDGAKFVPIAEHVRSVESPRPSAQKDGEPDSRDITQSPLQISRESSAEPRAPTTNFQPPAHSSTLASGSKPWWTPDNEKRIPILWRKAGSTQTTPINPVQMERQIPVTVVGQALPGDCALALLGCMLKDSAHWQRGSWWFGGLEQKAPRTSCLFDFEDKVPSPAQMGSACCARKKSQLYNRQVKNSGQ